MEAISAYVFDFADEVSRLQRELGAAADPLVFVNVEPTETDAVFHHVVAGKAVSAAFLDRALPRGKEEFSGALGASSAVYFNRAGVALFFNERSLGRDWMGPAQSEIGSLVILYHETGHMLAPDTGKDGLGNSYRECVADAYAALKLLRRFGDEASGFLSTLSWVRTMGAIIGGTEHLTTTVIDKILADRAHEDFSRLSEEETLAFARAYADAWTPRQKRMEALAAVARPLRESGHSIDTIPALMNSTFLSSPDPLLRYLGVKALEPFRGAESVEFCGKPVSYDGALLPPARGVLAGMTLEDVVGLSGVFNSQAASGALLESVRVRPPAGGRIVFNP